MAKRIIVLGGYGALGRHISRALATNPSLECVIAGRRADKARPYVGVNGSALTVDVQESSSLRRALDGAFAVVNAIGTTQDPDYTVAEACVGMGVHYVDLAAGRTHVDGISRLNRRAQQKECLIVSGASSVPAVSAALVDLLAPEFDRISEIHVSLAPGNKNPRGVASLRAMLGMAGTPFRIKENGRWRYAYGWSESQKIVFPAPVGKRRVYQCDAPDLDIFPTRYGALSISVRAGLGLPLFNRGLVVLGQLRRWGWVKQLPRWAPTLTVSSRWFHGFGPSADGMRVLVRGRKDSAELQHTVFLVARSAGAVAIAAAPALALIRKWTERGVPATGAVACVGLVGWDDIKAELLHQDIVLVRM